MNFSIRARHQSRKFLIQALYQWEMTHENPEEILVQFLSEMSPKKNDIPYFQEIFLGLLKEKNAIDALYHPFLKHDKTLIVGPIEKSLLRLGTYELKHRLDLPYKVVLNECIELSKTFAPDNAYQYINGVLDKLIPSLRPIEYKDNSQ
jgi:N utilization substance protein B